MRIRIRLRIQLINFDADPNPDCNLMRMRIQVTKMMRIRIHNLLYGRFSEDTAVPPHYLIQRSMDQWSWRRLPAWRPSILWPAALKGVSTAEADSTVVFRWPATGELAAWTVSFLSIDSKTRYIGKVSISVAGPDPGFGMGKKIRIRIWDEQPGSYFRGWKYLNSLTQIRDGKNSDPGSRINIPDPQHCYRYQDGYMDGNVH